MDSSGGTIYFSDEVPILTKEEYILKEYAGSQKFTVVDNRTIDTLIRRASRKQMEQQRQINAKKVLETRMQARIEEMEKGTPFTFNDIIFAKDSITYENQVLKADGITTKSILTHFYGAYSDDKLNFDRVLDTYATQIVVDSEDKIVKGQFGNITFSVESRKNSSGKARLCYINDYRINNAETYDVLKRALCYTKQEDYNNFLDTVSYCSLRIHKYLASGIDVRVQDMILDTNIIFKVPIIRKKNINFISINNKEFRISDTNMLLKIEEATTMSDVINILINPNVTNLDGAAIKMVIDEGKKTWESIAQKDKELKENTLKKFNIQVGTFPCQNGTTYDGYLVKGKKRAYIIESNTMNIHENPTGRYICMIDQMGNEYNGTAKLINRIYALANDTMLAKEIHTL
jgi:hypothetical protein